MLNLHACCFFNTSGLRPRASSRLRSLNNAGALHIFSIAAPDEQHENLFIASPPLPLSPPHSCIPTPSLPPYSHLDHLPQSGGWGVVVMVVLWKQARPLFLNESHSLAQTTLSGQREPKLMHFVSAGGPPGQELLTVRGKGISSL